MRRSTALTRVANEDQVEVAGVNDQGDRHVPEYFVSTNKRLEPSDEYQRSARDGYPQLLPMVF